jgi:hypothetical protein
VILQREGITPKIPKERIAENFDLFVSIYRDTLAILLKRLIGNYHRPKHMQAIVNFL